MALNTTALTVLSAVQVSTPYARLVGDLERKWWAYRDTHRLSAPPVDILATDIPSVPLVRDGSEENGAACQGATLTVDARWTIPPTNATACTLD